MHGADEIFTSGPENLVAQSKVIVTGPVVNFSKRVLQSDRASGTPLHWEISGEVRQSQVLKGDPPPLPIRFTRAEQALFLDQPETSYWEGDYLEWQTADHALIFFTGAGTSKEMRVYPSGSGERDLASLVRRVAAIQSIGDAAKRFEAWRTALKSSSAAVEKQAVLRSLMSFRKPWNEILPVLRQEMASSATETRGFVFGLVAYGIRHDYWPDANAPTEFICEHLERETNQNLTVRYLDTFGLLLNFAGQGDRKALRERLDVCLREKCRAESKETAEACRDLRARYAR